MSTPLRPGDPVTLGRYELVGRLGEGGMGTVFLGRAPDGRPVAIKMVRPELAFETEFRGRFRSEVNRAKQVPPFSTAEVLDADPDHEPPYLVVEFVDGPSLAAEIREKGPLSGAALHGVAVGTATALTAIHSAGVIHRDLKPGNVLFARGGIKVIDFGIAQAFEATSQHTRTDQMVGTVAYMAPERFDAKDARPLTAAADIFAWGALVAYAATGRTPFAGDSAPATAMRILTQPPDLSGLPPTLRGPVERALAKEPRDRPTARELLDLLLAASTPAPAMFAAPAPPEADTMPVALPAPSSPPVPPAPRRKRGLAIAATATAVLLVAAGIGAAVRHQNLADDLAAGGSPSAPASVSPSVRPSAVPGRSLTAEEKLQNIMLGKHRTLIHLHDIDRDMALEDAGSEVLAKDGTGAKSEFALIPQGVDFMIRALFDPAGDQVCLGVRLVPGASAKIAPADCKPIDATLFQLHATGDRDDRDRPTYLIENDAHGFLQWSPDRGAFYVERVGDADPLVTFSFVDRGPMPSPSPGN